MDQLAVSILVLLSTFFTQVSAQNECNSNPCANNATCVDGFAGYYICQCPTDYIGVNCDLYRTSRSGMCAGGNIFSPGEVREDFNLPHRYQCYYLIAIYNADFIDITFTRFGIEANKDEIAIGPGAVIDITRMDPNTFVFDNATSPLDPSVVPNMTVTIAGPLAWIEVTTDRNVLSKGYRFIVSSDGDDCYSAPCLNGATCVDQYNTYECICASGYAGSNCAIELDFCISNPCQNGGICRSDTSGYTCACPVGFVGVNCETNVDDCQSQPCLNGAICIDGIEEYHCQCVGQWTGTYCEISLDACISSPCLNGATCVGVGEDYVCECHVGFVGDFCEIDINECSSLPCQNGASCIDGPGRYTCQCRLGFSGINCEEVGFCDLEGEWYNECNDRITISRTSTGMLLGDHISNVELLTGYSAPVVMVGYANQNCAMPTFGFVVSRDNGVSTTSWSGQCHLCDGEDILYTTWTNSRKVDTCVDIKRATMVGQDKWTRYKQSQAPRQE